MKNYQRQYPLFSACGLNCGLCPRYHTDGTSRCPGCGGEGFFEKRPSCGVITCSQRHGGIEYCYLCDEYPCKRYDRKDDVDSFISYRNVRKDFEKAKNAGLAHYQSELNEKVAILQVLLKDYNDGRRKNFYCIAVNLLELCDIKEVMAQLAKEVKPDAAVKERVARAVQLFQEMAEKRNITLKLNKKKAPQKSE